MSPLCILPCFLLLSANWCSNIAILWVGVELQPMFSCVSTRLSGFLLHPKNMVVGQMVTVNYPQGVKEPGLAPSASEIDSGSKTLARSKWILWIDDQTHNISYFSFLLHHTFYSSSCSSRCREFVCGVCTVQKTVVVSRIHGEPQLNDSSSETMQKQLLLLSLGGR